MTAALLVDAEPITRPSGILWLAICCYAIAVYLACNCVLILTGVVSLASGAYVLGEYTTMGPLLFLVVALALVLLGLGLQRGWRWTRRVALVAAALLVATAVMPVSAAVIYFQFAVALIHGAKIIAAITAIRYLMQPDVVEFFNARSAKSAT